MFRKARLHAVWLAALALMLFGAQAALARGACKVMYHAPSHELAATLEERCDANCHELGASTSLCVPHCNTLTLDKPKAKLPVHAPQPAFLVSVLYTPPKALVAPERSELTRATVPPRILFQSLLI